MLRHGPGERDERTREMLFVSDADSGRTWEEGRKDEGNVVGDEMIVRVVVPKNESVASVVVSKIVYFGNNDGCYGCVN